jgi:hypothetical protein
MKWTPIACLAMMLAGALPASAQVSESSPPSSPDGVPLTDVVAALSKKLTPDATKISYSDFFVAGSRARRGRADSAGHWFHSSGTSPVRA